MSKSTHHAGWLATAAFLMIAAFGLGSASTSTAAPIAADEADPLALTCRTMKCPADKICINTMQCTPDGDCFEVGRCVSPP